MSQAHPVNALFSWQVSLRASPLRSWPDALMRDARSYYTMYFRSRLLLGASSSTQASMWGTVVSVLLLCWINQDHPRRPLRHDEHSF